ncbi:unnamed protein product [Ixodes hexagonus]
MHCAFKPPAATWCRTALAGVAFVAAFTFILVSYFGGGSSSRLSYRWVRLQPAARRRQSGPQQTRAANDSGAAPPRNFDMDASDVIVFVQIQNAGANFLERRLIEDLDLRRPCACRRGRKACRCRRPHGAGSWLFSRYTLGWKCGVHPDWTELVGCVDRVLDEDEGSPVKRRYFYITVLRDPVARFRSEWRRFHQNRGWHGGPPHPCADDRPPDTADCFGTRSPDNVSWAEFLACPANPALNRQTHMLADRGLVDGCNGSADAPLAGADRDVVLLASARRNLRRMAFFGLAEFPRLSQGLFEATFGLHFRPAPHRGSLRGRWKGRPHGPTGQAGAIAAANGLDVRLYAYAKDLLFSRFQALKEAHPDLQEDGAPGEGDWAEQEDLFDGP